MRKKYVGYLCLIAATAVLFIILRTHGRADHTPLNIKHRHEKKIVHNDTINALILYHAADYFVYQGSVIGFQYDLLKQMSKDLGKPLNITIEIDPDKAYLAAFTNDYDIVGLDFNKDFFSPEYILQSEPHSYTYPVLIMRKKMDIDSLDDSVHWVHAPARYSADIDFNILENEKNWKIKREKGKTEEDLFDMLEDTLIDFVVCNYNVAITMLPFYTSLTMGPTIGENFARTWVLNPHHQKLNESINQWLRNFKETNKYQGLCNKYLSRHSYVIQNSFGTKRNKISSYDKCMKEACSRYNIDWRFMSSIIFQESHFSSDVLGMGGAFGIMQMMPNTCQQYGITDTSTVEQQLWAGAKHISYLYRIFADKVDSTEIYYFVAGAYNSGPGHILDAIALCKKHEGNATHWQNVAEYLALKSHKEYYSDPVVKCGYYPGKHTINYVNEVMNRFNGYLITKKEE